MNVVFVQMQPVPEFCFEN